MARNLINFQSPREIKDLGLYWCRELDFLLFIVAGDMKTEALYRRKMPTQMPRPSDHCIGDLLAFKAFVASDTLWILLIQSFAMLIS